MKNDQTGGLQCLQIIMYIHIFSEDTDFPQWNLKFRKAIKLGMDELCFTEHSDYDVPNVVNCDYDFLF